MESIDKLRTAARNMAKGRNLEHHEECNLLLIIADEIEREIAERYMELPLDADGVPIHVGDVMEGVDKYDTLRNVKGEVIEISFNATDSEGLVASVALQVWAANGKSWHRSYIDPYASVYRHVKPRTLEDVLREFTDAVFRWDAEDGTVADTDTWSELVKPYADEIRELMGVDE